MAQVAECLLCKHEALSSNPSPPPIFFFKLVNDGLERKKKKLVGLEMCKALGSIQAPQEKQANKLVLD
jgi:hypothetical protein